MFSGQGSQYFQMGRPLFEASTVFRKHLQRFDELLRELSGISALDALYGKQRDRAEPFDDILLTHPAIFIVEYALAKALMDAGGVPEMVLGTSLGSFAAAALAGIIPAEEALAAVVYQARALEESCEPGGMVAVLADPALYREAFFADRSELAAINFSSHFVVAAPAEQCREIERQLAARKLPSQRLPVSFAFHSRWLDAAQGRFEASTQCIRF